MFKSGGGSENSEDDDFENAHFDSQIVLEHFQKKNACEPGWIHQYLSSH